MRGLSGDRCRLCAHYECCGGPQYGCYPSFPEDGDGADEDMEEEEETEDSAEPGRDNERR